MYKTLYCSKCGSIINIFIEDAFGCTVIKKECPNGCVAVFEERVTECKIIDEPLKNMIKQEG